MRKLLLAALAAASLIAGPARAIADTPSVLPGEPEHRATLDAEHPTFTWEDSATGAPDPSVFLPTGPALRCTEAPFTCQHVLLDVATAGDLTVTLESTAAIELTEPAGVVCSSAPCPAVQDLDGYLYNVTAPGPKGRSLTNECATLSPSETCTVAVEPGLYVVEVEFYAAVEAPYLGTATLSPEPATGSPRPCSARPGSGRRPDGPGRPRSCPEAPPAAPQTITLEGCSFTLYYFRDSAERLQGHVPAGYVIRPYPIGPTEGSATIAAAAYDCDGVEVPGNTPAPGIFTVLSVLVYPPSGNLEGPAASDFYVLWVHADNPELVDALATHGMPAQHVPGMRFDKPALSVGVLTEVPWSSGAYQLRATGYHQDSVHPHDNTFVHVDAEGRPARMDFVTTKARDHFCYQAVEDLELECGTLDAADGTPVASFFGGSHRTAHNMWDHDPVTRAWLVLGPPEEIPASETQE
jgi:hypothetical protein